MTDKDIDIIEWSRKGDNDSNPALMHIFPKSGENLKQKKYFAVKDYEKALFYDRGQFCGEFSGGIYAINKESRIKGTEIVWFNIAMVQMPWGIPENTGIPTKDGFIVGLFGDLKLRITNISTFFTDLVGGSREWNVQDLKTWIKGVLHTSLRDIFHNQKLTEILIKSREQIANSILAKVGDEFLQYGLSLESFNILGIKPPRDALLLLEQPKKDTLDQAQALDEARKLFALQRQTVLERINKLNNDLHTLEDNYIAGSIDDETYESKKKALLNLIQEMKKNYEDLQKKND